MADVTMVDATQQPPSQPPLARHDSRLLDLVFAMDTTGSMGTYIRSACDNVRRIVEEIVAKESSDVRLALVEYRDHPPQDRTYVTQVHDFTPKVGEMKRWLDASKADGGGDAPEAVADALHDVLKLSWRPEATKICVLVSDAPPHGLEAAGDSFPNGCPAGHDPIAIARQLAEKAITLYVAGCEPALTRYKDFFAALAYVTGGQYVPLAAAGSLTQVIVGGAQEELSLETWMEEVNQQVMAEVAAQGRDNVDVAELSNQVWGRLNMAGARSKRLQVNKSAAAPTSDYAKSMSHCSSMEGVREKWKPSNDGGGSGVFGGKRRGGPPMMSFAMSSPAPPEARCAVFGAAAPPPLPPGGGGDAGGAPVDYSTVEDGIHVHQAERMVQKALRRNNIHM